MNEEKRQTLKGYSITFQIYAHNEQEAEEARTAIVGFIGHLRQYGRPVTAKKIVQAALNWDQNSIVKNRILKHFNE